MCDVAIERVRREHDLRVEFDPLAVTPRQQPCRAAHELGGIALVRRLGLRAASRTKRRDLRPHFGRDFIGSNRRSSARHQPRHRRPLRMLGLPSVRIPDRPRGVPSSSSAEIQGVRQASGTRILQRLDVTRSNVSRDARRFARRPGSPTVAVTPRRPPQRSTRPLHDLERQRPEQELLWVLAIAFGKRFPQLPARSKRRHSPDREHRLKCIGTLSPEASKRHQGLDQVAVAGDPRPRAPRETRRRSHRSPACAP